MLDAYTTSIGLARGFQETESVANFLMGNFGLGGFVAFKAAIAFGAIAVALRFDRHLRNHSEFTHSLYFTISFALVLIAAMPVINNLVLLGFV